MREAGFQLGALTIAIGLFAIGLSLTGESRRRRILQRARQWTLRAVAVVALCFATGEVALRLIYWDGMSFGGHTGPLVLSYQCCKTCC